MPSIRANVKPNTDKALTALSYTIDGIVLTNHKGQTADIQNIVADFTITESLYTASMILQLNIKDAANFIEEYQLIGQETIRVKIGRHDFTRTDWTNIDLMFYVTEYPIFGRDNNQQNTQIYSITAVSKQAYVSAFKRLSKAVVAPISTEIEKLLKNELLVDPKRISVIESTVDRVNAVLPYMNPLDSCYWLLRRAYDFNSRPFFLYESMIDGIRMESLTTLIDEKKNPTYRTYRDAKVYANAPGTADFFEEQISRIFDLTSDFKLSKVIPTVSNGAYASKSVLLDLCTKTIKNELFSYNSINPKTTLNSNLVLSKKYGIPYTSNADIRDIGTIHDAFTEYLPINSLAYSVNGSAKSYHDMMVNRLGTYNSTTETLDTITHELQVAGDFSLRPGRKIILEIPKAVDLKLFTKLKAKMKGNYDDLFDRTVSGKYLVTSVIHQFDEEYHCRMRVKRDSFTFDLNNS